MAEIRVEKKSRSSWCMGLIGLLVLLVIIWFLWQTFGRDRGRMNTASPAAATSTATTTPAATTGTIAAPVRTTETIAAPAGTTGASTMTPAGTTATGGTPAGVPTSATGAVQPGITPPGDRVTDAGACASTSDKLSLVGREAMLSNVRVFRIVGPRSFTLASGSEELLVIIDPGLSQEAGTQGQIEPGDTISRKGNFQRLRQDEISNISDSRFRELTEKGLEWLRKTQVYLHATEFSKVS